MNRIAIYDGYAVPKMDGFAGKKRRKSRRKGRRGGPAAQKNKMKSCAAKWRKGSKSGSYRRFMSSCLRK